MNDKIFCTKTGFAVKTLLVNSLSRHLGGDHLFDYFSRFGPVRSVRIHVHASNTFGFIRFEGFEAAAKALKMKHHAIDDRMIEVEIADDCHQDEPRNDELPIELTNATGTEFMDLNDDCLREVLARLRPIGLCSLRELSETNRNVRLEAITNEIFTRKFKRLRNDVETSEDNLERVLAKFGSSILHFLTDGFDDDDTVSIRKFRSIIERCSGCSGTLKTLRLRNYKFGENDIKAMKSLFGNLEGLDIFRCHFEGDAMDLFASCQSLGFYLFMN
ncbi:uncharacterized protein LOC119077341 [Bradysia coprophila]|uniref:uncharacterized protein LOC119077341 n=1 Tax=Bradysia coprophila TaxID=38358 RepID=UPI00187DCE1D|nr:uncharacterized protein LOC119077341 [Bradysia coprophila]